MSVDQFEEAKEANQKWKYSNERTSESWRKLKLRLSGIKPANDRVKSFNWKRRFNDSTCFSGWLASYYPIRRAHLTDYPRRRLHLFVIILKQYIYACKCLDKKPNMQEFQKLYYNGK